VFVVDSFFLQREVEAAVVVEVVLQAEVVLQVQVVLQVEVVLLSFLLVVIVLVFE
jgi:hypothetical protein